MTARKSLPARPSLESLRKQAKKLARESAGGAVDAIARARAQLPNVELPLSQRDAQLVIAREYGFAGWQDLRAEVLNRAGRGLDWAAAQGKHAIHNNDTEGLKRLLVEFPELVSWRDGDGGTLLAVAVVAYGDAGDEFREQMFTRPACAELLLDAGAGAGPLLVKDIVSSRAKGILDLFWRRGALPLTLSTIAARGDVDRIREYLNAPEHANDLDGANKAFLIASRWRHKAAASLLLDRCIALDGELGQRIERWRGRDAFIEYFENAHGLFGTPWQTLVVNEVKRAIRENDQASFDSWLQKESWLLDDSYVDLQVGLFQNAALNDRGAIISRLFELNPAILQRRPPPPAKAMEFAVEYGHAHLVPLLTRLWPLPDDLPHAAGTGDFPRVKRWFDDAGRPVLGNPADHHRGDGPGGAQQVLDCALAWACMNKQLDIAAFLVDHGANVNTNWSTHEPASILHECALYGNYEAAQFLIDRGVDMTIRDYRWNATAAGWAYHAAKDEKMADFLMEAEKKRKSGS